jgi:TRAP transporter 4TM/12TM fusion protein
MTTADGGPKAAARLFGLMCLGFSLFQIYTGVAGALPHMMQRAIHVMFALVLILGFPQFMGAAARRRLPVVDLLLAAAVVVAALHVAVNHEDLMNRVFSPDWLEYLLCLVLVACVFEACRRSMGWSLLVLMMVYFLYAILGPYVPGMWRHPGFGVADLVSRLYMSDVGLWGSITGVFAVIIAIFIIFGSVMAATGGGNSFIDISLILTGRQVGGAAKVATIASSLFGTISGSGMGNAAATGSVTIPMMKRLGYPPPFAAGVEAVASTGGQMMPPIMRAGAFVMSDITGIPYLRIMGAAFLPAMLFYTGVYFSIHFFALKARMAVIPDERIPRWKHVTTFGTMVNLLIPVGILIYYLMAGSCLGWAGSCATLAAMATYLACGEGAPIRGRVLNLLESLRAGGAILAKLAILVVVAQVIVSLITVTGVGTKFSSLLLSMGKDSLFPVLFITMVAALILGMGLPTVAAYLFTAAILVPAMVKLGVPILSAHMFVFYFAIIASITPPICTAVYAAAGIAQASWMETAKYAVLLGASSFVIPYLFAYNGALLLEEAWVSIVFEFILAFVLVLVLSAALMGHLALPLSPVQRAILLVGGLLFALDRPYLKLPGLLLVMAVAIWNYRESRAP